MYMISFRIMRISQRIQTFKELQQMCPLIMYHIIVVVVRDLIKVNPSGLEDHITIKDHVINLRSHHM